MRKHWKKGLIALVLVVALIFILSSMACGGGEATAPKLSPFQVLNNTVKSHTTKITKATSDIITLNTGVAQLRTDLEAGLAGIVNAPDLTANITSLQTQIASLRASDNATQLQIDTVAGKVETAKTNIAAMQLLVDAIMDNFNTLSYRLDLIETSLNMSP